MPGYLELFSCAIVVPDIDPLPYVWIFGWLGTYQVLHVVTHDHNIKKNTRLTAMSSKSLVMCVGACLSIQVEQDYI